MAFGYPFKLENMRQDITWDTATPFIEFLEDLRRIDICSPALNFYENVNAANPTLTFGEVIEQFTPKQGWSKSMLTVYDGKFSNRLKKMFMDIVTDDVLNYKLWKDLVHITQTELGQLRKKFKGKLPNIERDFDDNN